MDDSIFLANCKIRSNCPTMESNSNSDDKYDNNYSTSIFFKQYVKGGSNMTCFPFPVVFSVQFVLYPDDM
jgi:hypothetical protein